MKLTSKPSDSRIGFGAKEGLPDLGSRLALISSDRAALGLWTDTRAGVPATQKQDLAAAAVAVSDPARLSGFARERAALRRHRARARRAGAARRSGCAAAARPQPA